MTHWTFDFLSFCLGLIIGVGATAYAFWRANQ